MSEWEAAHPQENISNRQGRRDQSQQRQRTRKRKDSEDVSHSGARLVPVYPPPPPYCQIITAANMDNRLLLSPSTATHESIHPTWTYDLQRKLGRRAQMEEWRGLWATMLHTFQCTPHDLYTWELHRVLHFKVIVEATRGNLSCDEELAGGHGLRVLHAFSSKDCWLCLKSVSRISPWLFHSRQTPGVMGVRRLDTLDSIEVSVVRLLCISKGSHSSPHRLCQACDTPNLHDGQDTRFTPTSSRQPHSSIVAHGRQTALG